MAARTRGGRRAAATMPAGIATRPASGDDRSSESAMPTMRNTGSPTAGIVHTQSPPVWTAKYAAAPSAPVARSELRERRAMPNRSAAPDPITSRKPMTPVSAERVELERVGAMWCLEALSVDEIRVAPAVRADAGERMTLELVPGDAPEVVAIRAERAEVARRRTRPGRAFRKSSQRSCVARTGWSTAAKKPTTTGQQRCADEAEHDSSRPDSRRVRDAKPPVDQCVHEADERADACEHERDRAGVAHGVVERLSVGPVRLRQRFRREGAEHGDDGCRARAAAIACLRRRRRRTPTRRARRRAPLLWVPSQRQAIAVAPPSASARIAA